MREAVKLWEMTAGDAMLMGETDMKLSAAVLADFMLPLSRSPQDLEQTRQRYGGFIKALRERLPDVHAEVALAASRVRIAKGWPLKSASLDPADIHRTALGFLHHILPACRSAAELERALDLHHELLRSLDRQDHDAINAAIVTRRNELSQPKIGTENRLL